MTLTDYRIKGLTAPDMSEPAFVRALWEGGSPVGPQDAQTVYGYCVARQVSPAWLLATFHHESNMGTKGTATVSKSWGNTRRPSFGVPDIGKVAGRSGTFSKYANWGDGGVSTVARICDHKPYANAFTVRAWCPIWAPSSDGNNVERYISAVAAMMERLAAPAPPGAKERDTMLVPKPAMTQRPSPNRGGYPGTRRVDAVVWHVTAGGEAGSLSWLTNPASSASSNYLIGKDGTIYELVPPTEDAWANGAVKQPDTKNPLINKWIAEGVNFNQRTVSIETARETSANEQPGGFTPAQYASLVNLTAWLCDTFNLTPDRTHIMGHRAIDSVNRLHCPGLATSEWFSLVAAVAARVNGPTPPAPQRPAGWLGVGDEDRFKWEGEGIIVARWSRWYNPDTKRFYHRKWAADNGYENWVEEA